MPSPSTSLATLRPDLAGSFMEFDLAMDREGFIASRVAPVIEVAKQSGKYGKIPVEQLLRQRDTLRAPGSGYSRSNFTFTTASFSCDEHGAEEPVDDREARMYRDYFDAELVVSQRARDAVLRNAEIRMADLIFNTTTWTGSSLTTALSTKWSDATNATPVDDVNAAKNKVYDGAGMWPNAIVMHRKALLELRETDQVRDRIAASGAGSPNRAGQITLQQIAEVFDLDIVLVAGSSKNTADEGQSASFSTIWDSSKVQVCRIATGRDIREPCIARTFHWAEDGSDIGGQVESYRDETVRGDIIRVRHDVDEKVTYKELGHLLTSVI